MKCIIYLFSGSAGHDEINMSVSVKKQKNKNESKTDMEGGEREQRANERAAEQKLEQQIWHSRVPTNTCSNSEPASGEEHSGVCREKETAE